MCPVSTVISLYIFAVWFKEEQCLYRYNFNLDFLCEFCFSQMTVLIYSNECSDTDFDICSFTGKMQKKPDEFTKLSPPWNKSCSLAKMMSTCSCEFVTNFPLCFLPKNLRQPNYLLTLNF